MDIRQADRIADSLEEMVFTGHFEQGQRLDETSLAQLFGVSRTPVREALQRLVGVDLAEQRPRRGVFVKQPLSRRIEEMFEAMAEIEAVCGRLAAERMTKSDLRVLSDINEECKAAIDSDDPDAYSRHNEAFHLAIFAMAGNAFLAEEAGRLYRRLKPFRRVKFRLTERMRQSVREHDAFLNAISSRDPETAAYELRRHIGTQGPRFPQQMEKLRETAAKPNAENNGI